MPEPILRPSFASILGRLPIHPIPFVLAKLAVLSAVAVPVLGAFGAPVPTASSRAIRLAAAGIFVLGSAVLLASLANLGASARVGLPREKTALRTGALYGLSRNPVYVGVYVLCLGAALYSPHWFVIACSLVGVALHHRIVLAEERFLDARFGPAWRAYRAKVRRYL